MRLFEFLRRLTRREMPVRGAGAFSSPELLQRLLMSIERTQEVELSCDEAFALLDQFAERQLREAEAARLMPLLEHHLKMCADCREEYEAVVRILKASGASSTL